MAKQVSKINHLKSQIASVIARIEHIKQIEDRLSNLEKSLDDYFRIWKLHDQDPRVARLTNEIERLKKQVIQLDELKTQLGKLQGELNSEEKEKNEVKTIKSLEKSIQEKKKELEKYERKEKSRKITKQPPIRPSHLPYTIRPSWDNVRFMDGFVRIHHGKNVYDVRIGQSKAYLEKIKGLYQFKRVPLLELQVTEQGAKVLNEEVLFFNVRFLSLYGVAFEQPEYQKSTVLEWKKYTKGFYKNKLEYLFHTDSLRKLCEICDDQLPIVPAAERIINVSGAVHIHHSFLFPVRGRNEYNVIWESEEESKASYIFKVTGPYLDSIQLLYEFIAGETLNKRESIIHSVSLQRELQLKGRIFHTSFSDWLRQVRGFL